MCDVWRRPIPSHQTVTTLFLTGYFLLCGLSLLFVTLEKKRTWCYRQLSSLFLTATHLPDWVHFLKPCSASDAQPAVHCSETLDSISGLSELCVQSFHSTSERFPQYKAQLFSSSPVTAKTTVWFLDGTNTLGGWLTLSKMLGERSCKPGLRTLCVDSCGVEKCTYSWTNPVW